MSVAIRTITRVQDADDFGSTPGAGNDGYALTWDNGAGEFVLAAAGVTDHGALSGLSDDDHSGYALLAGRSGGQTLYGGTAAGNGLTLYSTSHATKGNIALGTTLTVDSVNGRVGIGTTTPGGKLHVSGTTFLNGGLDVGDTAYYDSSVAFSVKSNRAYIFNMYNDSVQPLLFLTQAGVLRLYRGVFQADAEGSHYILGSLGVGTAAPGTRIHALMVDTATNAVTNVVTIGHDTTETAAAGFGAGLLYQLESSTTAAQDAARIAASWIVATHASRTARLALSAYDYNGAREGVRIDTNGSAALLGFYGHAATAQQTLATGAGASADDIITALQNLGLVKQS